MQLTTQQHYELIAQFEKEFRTEGRLTREAKELWPRGHIYQDGRLNELFLAYRKGCAYGLALSRGGE